MVVKQITASRHGLTYTLNVSGYPRPDTVMLLTAGVLI